MVETHFYSLWLLLTLRSSPSLTCVAGHWGWCHEWSGRPVAGGRPSLCCGSGSILCLREQELGSLAQKRAPVSWGLPAAVRTPRRHAGMQRGWGWGCGRALGGRHCANQQITQSLERSWGEEGGLRLPHCIPGCGSEAREALRAQEGGHRGPGAAGQGGRAQEGREWRRVGRSPVATTWASWTQSPRRTILFPT